MKQEVSNLLTDFQITIDDLKQQLAKTRICSECNEKPCTRTAYVALYVLEVGGMQIERCIGVFSKKSRAIKAISDCVSKCNNIPIDHFNIVDFNIIEFDVDHTVVPETEIRVAYCKGTLTHEAALYIKGVYNHEKSAPIGTNHNELYKVDCV